MKTEAYGLDNDTLPDKTLTIPIIEEQLIIDKEVKETGKLHIAKHITEETGTVTVPLMHEEHSIEHVPVNAFVDELPVVRQEGETMIIPVLKEVMVKRMLLVEEIRITKHTVQTNEPQQVTLRKENVTIERL